MGQEQDYKKKTKKVRSENSGDIVMAFGVYMWKSSLKGINM